MDTCTVETGLLKKKPCGHPAVTHCLNCEQPLCAQHAVPELTDTGRKSGKFLCKECEAAHREQKKSLAAVAKSAPPPAPPAKKPAAPAPGKDAPAQGKGSPSDDGAIDFTPGKK
ncbi:MAG: hypothetical protein A3G28_06515 [Betaproteobacteria bacterium RIFCSPLOWO2_12_FULL_68_19]|nr:MAG: hypothetical protein A3G28_06515 [Betaproteobacteria bacterium RIFCSPLOWO2_12_FULL_68_19]